MTCRFYNASDFNEILDDLCSDDTSSEDISSRESSSLAVLKVHQEGNKKTKVIDCDGQIIQFEAYFPKPKVIHTDMRRSYGTMFVNAMNSGDLPLLYGFLDTFLVPNATKISTKNFKSKPNPFSLHQSHVSEQQGVVDIAKHWYCRMQMSPDTVIGVKDIKIVSNSKTEETKIISRFTMKATKIMGEFNHGFCHDHSQEKQTGPVCTKCNLNHFMKPDPSHKKWCSPIIVPRKKRPLDASMKEHEMNIEDIVASVSALVSTIPRRAEPIQLSAEGVFTMYIDEHRRITRLEMSVDV